jgi:hypothetical protein
MKKILTTLAAVVCCAMTMTVFTACSVDDNSTMTPANEPLAEYTIMYYGHGGGNRDDLYLPKIEDFYKASKEAYKRANVVVQYKFSTTEGMLGQEYWTEETCEDYGGKTFRWAVDPSQDFYDQLDADGSRFGGDNVDITCPDSLTNFINWAAKTYPAKKYLLIVHDHGGGYMPHDELPETAPATTRGMLYDDGNDYRHFTAKSFHRAVAAANVRLETIFMDACLMNNLEYQFELQDLCDYVIAPTYSEPAAGGAYKVLVEQLAQPSVNIEDRLTTYCKTCIESWDEAWHIDETTPLYTDMTVTRTASIAHLGEMLREFTDKLCDTYQNGTDAQRETIDYCTASAIKVQINRPSYDAVKYVKSLINALPEVYGDEFYNQMKHAFNNCIVGQYFSKYLTAHNYKVDYSVMLGVEGAYPYTVWKKDEETGGQTPLGMEVYSKDGGLYGFYLYPTDDPQYYRMEAISETFTWPSTLADTYEQLAFDRSVGWSRWLRLNRQWPNVFCPSDLYFELPMPEEERIHD